MTPLARSGGYGSDVTRFTSLTFALWHTGEA